MLFENCRRIAEVEICPNLLPQTGPTGGGDSKVDSETYPVAEEISTFWYYGNGNRAATERWAFAISAKKDWKPKVKSDIAKIVKVNHEEKRGYTKAFFMSNQYISDKKRADTEDELRKLYNLDVRILDRTWLLNKALKSTKNIEITIKCFGLSDSFADEIQIGERDYKRKREYEQNENKLLNDNMKNAEIVALSKRNLILARELEFSKQQILGLIERNNRIAKEYGMTVDIAEAFYDAAWTIYWWYSDAELYYNYYKEYEKVAITENNVNFFINLTTLWMNLYSLASENKNILLKTHTEQLKEKYKYFVSDPSKPNTVIEAKAAYQMIRFFLGDKPDDIVDDMIQIVEDSQGHLDLDLYPLSQAIQRLPIFEEAKHYNELFERMVSIMSQQKQESEAALMLAKRGHTLKERKPYEALSYFSRALMGLYNESSKYHLITVFCFSSIMCDFEEIKMKRSEKSNITSMEDKEEIIFPIEAEKIKRDELPDGVDFKNISNADINTSSIINIPLWNVCGWKGVLFLASPVHQFPPILSFAFTKDTCRSIFEDWINDFGYNDRQNKIGIRIIKGIDKNHPYWYRVIIGQLSFSHKEKNAPQIIAMPVRFHTMEPNNDTNLKMFEQELQVVKSFSICPSYFYDISAQPQIFKDLMIRKNIESIIICNAYEVPETDWLMEAGILPTDIPIIPEGMEEAPILSIIDRKKRM